MDFEAWLGTTNDDNLKPQASIRAASAWRRIQDNPSTVAVWRSGSYSHNATVRVEWNNNTNRFPNAQSPNTVTAITEVVLFGIIGHPTEDDTNIIEGDEVYLSGEGFIVKDVMVSLGEKQVRCTRMT